MTEEEKTLLINEIVDYLISHSQSVEGIPIQENLDGVSSFPAIKEVLNEESQVVRVSLDSILPEFRYYNGYVQYRFSSGNWINLFQVSTSLDGYATKDYVDLKVNEVISNAPVTLNTLNKIAAALNYDPSFYQNIYQAINTKWTTNSVKIANWDQAFIDRHVHDNISSLNLITDILVGKWNEAYSWGDHSEAGYEHGLGSPLSNGQILSSNTDGSRSWVNQYIHPQSTVVPGIYTKVTVDLNGHVTYGNGLSQTDIPSISWNQVPFDRPTTLLGYGITDAYTKNYIDKYLQRKYSGVVDISEILLNENTVTVPASKVNLYSNSKFEGYVSEYEIAEKTFIITGIDVKYIVVSYNDGSPEYIITQERGMINYSNVIPIITLIYDGVKIHSVNWDEQANGLSERLLKRLNRTQRFQRDGGLLINVDGSRTITISQSTIYFGASEVVYPSSSSSTNLIYQYHHSDGVWTYTRSQFLNNLEYDNGTGLVSLSNDNRYTVNWVYAGVGDDGDIITVLGTGDYKLDEVINAQPPSILPDIIRFHGILVGKVIYQKGLNIPYQVISISEQSISSGGSVVEHNNLNGLQGGNLEEFYHLNHSEYLNAQDSSSFSSTPGTYRSVTTDSKGRVISGTNPTTLSEYGISDEDVTNSLLTGYSLGQNTEVSSTDSIIGSIGKLQAYINARQGTVTSVGISVPLGFTVLNSPITANGVIGLGYAEGYSLPSNSIQSNWSSAYAYSLIGHLPLTGGNLSGNLGITGDLNISGNIYQSGSVYETHAENIYSKNDYIYMRDGATSGLLEGFYSGLEFVKYDGVNNGRLAIDSYGVARVGDVGDEQPLATREESPLSNGYAYWDNTNKRFSTKLIPFSEIANKPTTLTGYGITDSQPLDADLSAIAALIGTSGLLRKTAANTWSLDTNIYLTGITKAQVEAVLTGDIATHTHSQYLTGNQTITISGDATGSGTTAIALTLANSGVVAGTYNNLATQVIPFTVDAKGIITSIGTAVTITPDWVSVTGKPTTISGYNITDAVTIDTIQNITGSKTFSNGTFGNSIHIWRSNTEASVIKYYNGLTKTLLGSIGIQATGLPGYWDSLMNVFTLLHSGNYNNYSPSLIGSGASGTWAINITGNASTSSKVNNALTFTGYSTGTFNGSNALSVAIPSDTNQLTNGAGYITSSASITGNAATATKLATARAIAGVLFDGFANIDIPFANLSSKPTTLGGYGITDALNLSGGQLTGQLSLLQGAGGGIVFPDNSFGGGGDSASIKLLNPAGGESTEMTFTMANDADDIINFNVPSIDGVKINRYTVWNAGNFTNLNQLTTRNFSDIQNKPTTLGGYGITDAYTKTQTDAFLALKLDVATFSDLFDKVNIGTELSPVYAIKAKYNFYSVGEVSAFGAGTGSGGSGLIQTVESGFYIVDSEGKVAIKYDANGVDVAKLSDHLKNLIKSIPGIGNAIVSGSGGVSETVESGFYIVDSEGKVAIKYDANGLDVAKLSTNFKSLLPSITETLPFSGKTINILSDSITDFKQWTTPLKSYLGCTFGHPSDKDELSSWGLSGSRFSDTGSSSMSVRYTLMSEADLVIVFGGTNDWGLQWSNEVGTFADRTQATFYGALHYTFSGLIAKYPTTPIVIMTPMHRRGEIFSLWTAAPSTYTANSSGITVNHRGKTFREYVNIIKEVAEFYSLPVIDVYGELGISAFGDNYTTWYNSDGIHPILEGGKAIAKFVISKLNNIYKQYNIS